MPNFPSWGRFPKAEQDARLVYWTADPLDFTDPRPRLPRGLGRSYGDSCLNDGGVLLCSRPIDRMISFDEETGILRCEAGATIEQIIDVFLPRGWFVPVTPGTKHVTVGGAIANDVHGKNHHVAGTFGRFVPRFELVRSSGERLICSETENTDLYRATIGGLGLTGFVTWAEVRLKRVPGPKIRMDSIKFRNLDEFLELSGKAESSHEYTVAWLDTIATGDAFGRGIFMAGSHAEGGTFKKKSAKLVIPFDPPFGLLNRHTVRAFNTLYYNKQLSRSLTKIVDHDPFFYPLDSVLEWNKMYGKAGFLQFQCVVPKEPGHTALRDLLRIVVDSQSASFLAVMKEFGDVPSPGLLSFPRPGVTLCLDFANRGRGTLELMRRLELRVVEAGGALYPAKDACMSPDSFKAFFPRWEEMMRLKDPAISSSFWRRVTA